MDTVQDGLCALAVRVLRMAADAAPFWTQGGIVQVAAAAAIPPAPHRVEIVCLGGGGLDVGGGSHDGEGWDGV